PRARLAVPRRRFHLLIPHITVTIDQLAGPATLAPVHQPGLADALPGLSPFILWDWTQYRVTVAPPLTDTTLLTGDLPAEVLSSRRAPPHHLGFCYRVVDETLCSPRSRR